MGSTYKKLSLQQQQKIDRELDPGEQVLWTGQPKPRWFSGGSIGTFLFAIPWTGFAIFWIAMASQIWGENNLPFVANLFPLFGVPFVLIGLYMLSSPIREYRKSRNTLYVITDLEVIVMTGGRSTTIRSYRPEDLFEIFRTDHADGTGDIVSTGGMVLHGVSQPRLVEDLVQKLAEKYDEGSYNEDKF